MLGKVSAVGDPSDGLPVAVDPARSRCVLPGTASLIDCGVDVPVEVPRRGILAC